LHTQIRSKMVLQLLTGRSFGTNTIDQEIAANYENMIPIRQTIRSTMFKVASLF
jgi:hypothetical protein